MVRKTRKQRRGKGEISPPGPSQCHPRVGLKRPSEGCLPPSILVRAAKKLKLAGAEVLSPADLRKALEKHLDTESGKEISFLEKLPLSQGEKDYLAKQYLRPKQPSVWISDPDMWLDSNNISAVMKQYEEAYPEFEFMGPFPIDFAAPDPYQTNEGPKRCLIREICGLRLEEAFHQGTKKVGIVYNLDPHFKDGSHWVANFIDVPGHHCYYFDSYGYAPPKQIAKFMKWLTLQDPKMKLSYNARRFQFKGSECGMYSMYFIIRMLLGDRFQPFCRKAPRDSAMLDLRDWLFST